MTDDADTGRPKRGCFGDSIGIQATNTEKGHGDLAADFTDFGRADGFIVGFGPSGVQGAESEVVRAQGLPGFGLAGGVGREAENCGRAELLSCFWNTQVILAEVTTCSSRGDDKIGMIIENEGKASLGEEWRENFCRSDNFILRKILGAELKNTCPSVCEFASK
jgi:hypothetical protein